MPSYVLVLQSRINYSQAYTYQKCSQTGKRGEETTISIFFVPRSCVDSIKRMKKRDIWHIHFKIYQISISF